MSDAYMRGFCTSRGRDAYKVSTPFLRARYVFFDEIFLLKYAVVTDLPFSAEESSSKSPESGNIFSSSGIVTSCSILSASIP